MISRSRQFVTYVGGALVVLVYSYVLVQALYPRPDILVVALPLILVAAILAYMQPFLGLFFVLLLSPIKTSGDEILVVAKLLGILTLLVVLLQRIIKRESIRWTGIEGPVLLMAFGMSLSFFRGSSISPVFYSLLSLTSLYALLLLCYQLVENQSDLQKLALMFMASGAYPIVQALLEWGQGPDPNRTYTRISGTFTIATGLGSFLIPVVILSLALAFYPRLSHLVRLGVLGVFGGGMLALVLTLSRGALFGALLGLLSVYLLLGSQLKNRLLVNAATLAMLAGAMWSAWPAFEGRVLTPVLGFLTGGSTATTVQQRADEFSLIIPMTLDYHFMGTGIGNYKDAVMRYRVLFDMPDLPSVPHNILLYFFGMVGIVGALGFVSLLLLLAFRIISSYRMMRASPHELSYYVYVGAAASLVGYLPLIITHTGLFTNEIWLAIAFFLISMRLGLEVTQVSDAQVGDVALEPTNKF